MFTSSEFRSPKQETRRGTESHGRRGDQPKQRKANRAPADGARTLDAGTPVRVKWPRYSRLRHQRTGTHVSISCKNFAHTAPCEREETERPESRGRGHTAETLPAGWGRKGPGAGQERSLRTPTFHRHKWARGTIHLHPWADFRKEGGSPRGWSWDCRTIPEP